jgi:uncharacterized protein (TIGR00730 family)
MRVFNSVCVYCGSSDLVSEDYLQAARDTARVLSERANRLVFGGGRTGLMGALAETALDLGMDVIGIIPERFDIPELVHDRLSEKIVVEDMHARKNLMAEMSDAFIALPGGFGTFDEFFEILTWAQIGKHQKPIGVLNTNGYFNTLMAFISEVEEKGFIYTNHRDLIAIHEDPMAILEYMSGYQPPKDLTRWVHRTR